MAVTVSAYCPFCRQHTQITPAPMNALKYGVGLQKFMPAEYSDEHGRDWWIGLCNNRLCKRVVLVDFAGSLIPSSAPSPTDERIPEHIRRDLIEAKQCAAVEAWRACLTMARRAIQAACLLKGADEGKKLHAQIDQLATEGIITNDLKDWAHEVRHLGNDGAHPPKDYSADVVEKEDAVDALALAEAFLAVVFVAPALAAERRAKRTAPPGTSTPGTP